MSTTSLHQLLKLVSDALRNQPRRRNRSLQERTETCSAEQLEQRQLLTVTVDYIYFNPQPVNLTEGPAVSQPAATSISTGGLAVAGNSGTNTDVDILNSDLSDGGGIIDLVGINPAIVQLSDLNLVVATQDSNSIRFAIRTLGGLSLFTKDIDDVDSSEPDVARGNGSFWIVNQDTNGFNNWDIEVRQYSNAGTLMAGDVIDSSSALDAKPAIAALDNGNMAIVWTRSIGFNTEIWRAIYSPTNGVVSPPTLIDTEGTTNRNVDISAIAGGYAMVYEDSGWNTGTRDITMKRFSNAGTLLGTTNISNPALTNDSSHDANPTITRLGNNLLAVGYEDNRLGQANTDSFFFLVDPATGSRLGTGINVGDGNGDGPDDVGEITIAGSANGRINIFHRNLTEGNAEGVWIVGRRTSTSNSASDTITGDFFIDTMIGGGGNDTLLGGGNNDILDGGSGIDTLNGQAGSDTLTGGTQADKFVFTSVTHSPPVTGFDTITDFSKAQNDKIDVSTIDAKVNTLGIDAFQFIGTASFSAEGQIRVVNAGANTVVQFNTIGTSGAEMEILLLGVPTNVVDATYFTLTSPLGAQIGASPPTSLSSSSALKSVGAAVSIATTTKALRPEEPITSANARLHDQHAKSIVPSTASMPAKGVTGRRTPQTLPTQVDRSSSELYQPLNSLDTVFSDMSILSPVL